MLEATGRYRELAAAELHAAGHRVHVANPRRIKDHARRGGGGEKRETVDGRASLGRRNQTDRIDAALIASFGTTRARPDWQPADPALQRLRELLRRLADLQSLLRAERNRAAAAAGVLVSKSLARMTRALEKEIERIESQIAAHLQAAPELHADLERLCQIEGLGERTAEEAEGTSGGRWTGEPRWLCAEVPRHLPNGRAAAAWLAVTPRVRQSGSSLRHTAPVGIEGNRHLRRVLFMAAMVARRLNPRLAAAGKAKRSVLFAVLHKLIKTAFALLKNQSTYNPTHNAFLTAEN